jgi:hypothetical protein
VGARPHCAKLPVGTAGTTAWNRNNGWVLDVAVDPIERDIVYAAAGGVRKSTDGGRTWKAVFTRARGTWIGVTGRYGGHDRMEPQQRLGPRPATVDRLVDGRVRARVQRARMLRVGRRREDVAHPTGRFRSRWVPVLPVVGRLVDVDTAVRVRARDVDDVWPARIERERPRSVVSRKRSE